MVDTPLFDLGTIGLVRDRPDHTLPPEAWTDMNNVRALGATLEKRTGTSQVFGTPSVAPAFVMAVPGTSQTFWLYTSLTKAYVYESGVHTNITRQTASVDVDYTAANYRDWNSFVFQGVPILNNGTDVPQYWGALSSATKLADLSNWPGATTKAKVMRGFGPYLVALNVTDAGTARPHMVMWSHKADPGSLPSSWDHTDATKDAGRIELTDATAGVLLDGLPLGNQFILYKENAVHVMRFIGGQDIFAFDIFKAAAGLLASRCVCIIGDGGRQFYASADDLYVHNGQEVKSLLRDRGRRAVFNDIDSTNYVNSFVFDNPRTKEAWFCYPTSGQTYPNTALVWNYEYDTIYPMTFTGTWAHTAAITDATTDTWTTTSGDWSTDPDAWSSEGRQRTVIAAPADTKFYMLDNTEQFDGSSFTAYAERTGLAVLGRDRAGKPKVDYTARKLVTRIWPKLTGTATVTIRLGAQEYRDGPVTWSEEKTFNQATQTYLDFEVSGRLLAMRISSSVNDDWKLDGYNLEIIKLGEN